METFYFSLPVTLAVFIALAYGLYQLGARLAAKGSPHPDKHRPYTGGEVVLPPARRMHYHAFFRLALMFGVLHVAVLVLSTLPPGTGPRHIAALYLVGAGVSVLVLTEGEL